MEEKSAYPTPRNQYQHAKTYNSSLRNLPPRFLGSGCPTTLRTHIASLGHLGRHRNRIALSVVDRLGRRSPANQIPADVVVGEVQLRIHILQVGFALRGDPVQAPPASAQGFVKGRGAGSLVPASARHRVVPFVVGCVAAGVAPVDAPEIPALVAAEVLWLAVLL